MNDAGRREHISNWNEGSLRERGRLSRRAFFAACAVAAATPCIASHAEIREDSGWFGGDGCNELVTLSVTEMRRLLRRKEVSPVELVQAHIYRFAHIEPSLNAVTHTAFAEALRTAAKAETTIRKDRVDWQAQPLVGVPFSVKNHIDVKGIPTTCGARGRSGQLASADADVVRHLKNAGAIFLAATNLPCLALSYETDNLLFGRTNNPYDLERTAGGSSGGEGAWVAACGSPLGVGSDYNGSIRVPSAWNGIAGLRPAPGRLSLKGMWPTVEEDEQSAWTIGPMARHVTDLEVALPFFLKTHASHQVPPLLPSNQVALKHLKVRFLVKWNHGIGTPAKEIQDAVIAAATTLQEGGSQVEEGLPDEFHRIGALTVAHVLSKDHFSLSDLQKQMRELDADQDPLLLAAVRSIGEWQQRVPDRVQQADAAAFVALKERFSALMRDVDALILPVLAEPAMKHGAAWPSTNSERGEEKYAYCYFCLLMGEHPAGTVRVASTSSGLPVGVQVIGRRYREDIVLRILSELEAKFGGWQPPPDSLM